ncbi:MAG: magnesium transporter [Clostridia bacterium]|nr:magnesium transporter [Clostridia bacterium]
MYKIIKIDDLPLIKDMTEKQAYEKISLNTVERLECLEGFDLIAFDWYDIYNPRQETTRIIIYFTDDTIIFICRDDNAKSMLDLKVKDHTSTEKILSTFFVELLKYDMDNLEDLEDQIFKFEDQLLTNPKAEIAREIVSFRRVLSLLKRYYEQLNSIIEELLENDNELITSSHMKYFKVLDNRVDRLFLSVLHLQDYVSQTREAYQAQVDIEQNSIMRTFTVVTSIFLPLTLIVGWYGMNLKMPEFEWYYGYPFVILICMAVFLVCIIYFRKKKWM